MDKSIQEQINIEIASNKMFAAIFFDPFEEEDIDIEIKSIEIEKLLQEKGICFGIDTKLLRTLEKTRKPNHKYLIAQGQQPIIGKPGKLIYHVEINKEAKPKIQEDGNVDFHKLDLIENVKKGQILVTLEPPEEGTPGINIFGESIPAPLGKSLRLPQGKNTVISEDGRHLIAAIDGQVSLVDNKVIVKKIYDIPSNVGPSTGDIDFIGDVVVKGNILTGFTVKSGGDIEVYGVVEGAYLVAEGDIILHRGIQGAGRGKLKAKGNIIAKYIENSEVEAEGEIHSEAIMHSSVKSGAHIYVEGKKGLIVGGVLRAYQSITAKTIGSSMATVTELEVGLDPSILEHYRLLKKTIKKLEKECKQTEQAVELLTRVQKNGESSKDKQQLLIKCTRAKIQIQQQMLKTKNEVEELSPLLEMKNQGTVKALQFIYPGVKVTIGNSNISIQEEIQYCTLYQEHGVIKIDVYR